MTDQAIRNGRYLITASVVYIAAYLIVANMSITESVGMFFAFLYIVYDAYNAGYDEATAENG